MLIMMFDLRDLFENLGELRWKGIEKWDLVVLCLFLVFVVFMFDVIILGGVVLNCVWGS